jgi:hypothetical protein
LEQRREILCARWPITYAYTYANQYPYLHSGRNTNSYCHPDINSNTYAESEHYPYRNNNAEQHAKSYSYTKVSSDAPTAADSSATPDASTASAFAAP